MAEKKEASRLTEHTPNDGFWDSIIQQLKLVWRLLKDSRVPIWTKTVPFLSVIYLFIPTDIMPDLFIGLGQLDDLAIIALGLKLFLELAPADVIQEHMDALTLSRYGWTLIEGETESVDESDS